MDGGSESTFSWMVAESSLSGMRLRYVCFCRRLPVWIVTTLLVMWELVKEKREFSAILYVSETMVWDTE